MGSDPQYNRFPNLSLAQHIFDMTNDAATTSVRGSALGALQQAINEHKMAPLYRYLAHPIDGIMNGSGEGSVSHAKKSKKSPPAMLSRQPSSDRVTMPWDEALYVKLAKDNDDELAAIQKQQDEAEEQEGDLEVLAARGKRAELYARIGDREKAISSHEETFDKTGALGTKIDLTLAIVRIGLFFSDRLCVRKYLDRASSLVESGGDWDRRNRLKAYRGLYLLTIRSYSLAAPLLLDSLSTFTSYELCSYSNLVVYSVLAGSVSLKRNDFKSKVVDAPEIRAILGDGEEKLAAFLGSTSAGPGSGDQNMQTSSSATPGPTASTAVNLTTLGSGSGPVESENPLDFSPLAGLVRSLYVGNYQPFFLALAAVEENFLIQDRYLHEHRGWFVREMRLRAYQQLLQSYRVVGLQSMAKDFGVSVEFLDKWVISRQAGQRSFVILSGSTTELAIDLAKFIAADRVACTIDRVNGIIETNRPDDKNKQYADVVKQGDALITKLQKYGQAVRLRGSERIV